MPDVEEGIEENILIVFSGTAGSFGLLTVAVCSFLEHASPEPRMARKKRIRKSFIY
jgi:hypothetical protein